MSATSDNDYDYEATPVSPTAAIMTAAASHGLICMSSSDLVRLLQQAGGGQANGYAAMANSLDAQSKTIGQQHAFVRELIVDYMAVVKELGTVNRTNFEHQRWAAQFAAEQRQFEVKAQITRDALARQNSTTSEMLTLIQGATTILAASGAVPAEIAQAVAAVAAAGSGAPAGAARPAQAPVSNVSPAPKEGPAEAPDSPSQPAPASPESAEEEGAASAAPSSAAGSKVRAALGRLSSSTIDKILDAATRPNPKLPNGQSTMAVVFHLLWEMLDPAAQMQIRNEVGMVTLLELAALFKRD